MMIMRLDDDSYFLGKLPEDPFLKMQRGRLKYMYKRSSNEIHGIQHLWDVSIPFSRHGLTTFKELGWVHGNKKYDGIEPYNNFHVTNIDEWRTPEAKAWFRAMDAYTGFSKYRFSDANVHAIFIGLFLKAKEVLVWSELRYVHNTNDDWSYPPSTDGWLVRQ